MFFSCPSLIIIFEASTNSAVPSFSQIIATDTLAALSPCRFRQRRFRQDARHAHFCILEPINALVASSWSRTESCWWPRCKLDLRHIHAGHPFATSPGWDITWLPLFFQYFPVFWSYLPRCAILYFDSSSALR